MFLRRLHALHLLGGICGLFYVLRKLVRKTNGVARNQRTWRVFDLLALHGFAVGVPASAARDPSSLKIAGGVVSESQRYCGRDTAPLMEPSPYGIQSKKLTMWLFIVSDAVTFGAVLFGYAYLRAGTPNWPTPFHFSPSIVNGMIMTFVLLTSSLTMLARSRGLPRPGANPHTLTMDGRDHRAGNHFRRAAPARVVSHVRGGLEPVQKSAGRPGSFSAPPFSASPACT